MTSQARTAAPAPATAVVARQGMLGLVGGISAGAGGLALTVVVGRLLPATDAGLYFTCVAGFTILTTVLLLGADTGLVRGLSALRAAGRAGEQRAMLRVALGPVVVVAALAAVALEVAAGPVATGISPAHAAQLTLALRLLAPFLVVSTLSTALLNGAGRGLGSLRTYTLVQQVMLPLGRPVLVGAVLVVAAAAGSVHRAAPLALLAWAVPLVPALLVGAREVSRRVAPADRSASVPSGGVTQFWRATAPRGVAATFEVLVVWADVVLVSAMLGAAPAAVYAAASRFVTSGTLALQAIRLSVAPLLAAAFARGDHVGAATVHRLSVRWSILSSWPVYLAMAAFAPGVLTVLGHGYTRAAPALTVLSVAMLGVVATGNANTVLNMAHRSHWAAANTGLAASVMVGLDLALVPRFGIVGAALGWSAAMLVDATLGVLEVHHGLGLASFDGSAVRAALVAVLGFGLPALAVRSAQQRFLDDVPAWTVLLTGCLVAGLTYAAVLTHQRRALALDELVASVRRRRPSPRTPTTPTLPTPRSAP